MNMLIIVSLALCMLARAEAGIFSPVYFTHSGNSIFVPELEYRKIIPYASKPFSYGYAAQVVKPQYYSIPYYTFPVIQSVVRSPEVHSTPLFLVPTVKAPPPVSTVEARANVAASGGAAGSSVVAKSLDSPVSAVANSVPGAAYSTAVVHPGRSAATVTAGAHATAYGVH